MTNTKPDTIIRNVYGLVPGLAMLAGIRLDIFSQLQASPMTSEKLADTMHVSEDKLSPLLYALVMAGGLGFENGVFFNTEESELFLVDGRDNYKDHICFLISKIMKVVSKTAETITAGKPFSKVDWSNASDHERALTLNGLFAGSRQAGRELGQRIDLPASNHILEVAGGSGGLAIGLCEIFPKLKMTIVDLPKVAKVTKENIIKAEMADRITVIKADVLHQSLIGHYESVVLRSFIQILSSKNAEIAINNISKAIVPGGSIYIIGHFLRDTRLLPECSVAHNLIFLGLYDHGQAYTEKEYRRWMDLAGFKNIQFEYDAFSDGTGIISGVKSE